MMFYVVGLAMIGFGVAMAAIDSLVRWVMMHWMVVKESMTLQSSGFPIAYLVAIR